jgi:PTH1 family peptidyl-tRNA hydrolase
MRLRFGIGHPGHRDDVIGYVLNAPTRDEQIEIEVAMTTALDVMPLIVAGEFNKAMQKLHTLT